jgi:hypothetical protein
MYMVEPRKGPELHQVYYLGKIGVFLQSFSRSNWSTLQSSAAKKIV